LPFGGKEVLDHPTIIEISKKLNKTTAQIVLKWNITRGIAVVTKSSNTERIQENINVFDFELTNEDMTEIEKLNVGWR